VRQRIIPFIPLTFGLLLTTSGLTVFTGGAPAAEECITQPDYKQQGGGHWHYRTDRSTNTKCWFLRPDDGEVQGAVDTADADAEDGAAVARQAAPRPVQRKPQQVTQQPAQQTARPSRSPDANTPASAAPTQGSASAPSNASATTAPWPWPGDHTVTQPAAPAPQPQTQPSANDLPKPVTPIRVQVVEQPAQTTDQQPPAPQAQEPPTPQAQALTEPVASPRTNVVEEVQLVGGSALDMLQTAFERLTTSVSAGALGEHSLALLATAFAFISIGFGVVVATIWSLPGKKPNQHVRDWDRDYREPTLEVMHEPYQEAHEQSFQEAYREPPAAPPTQPHESYSRAGTDTHNRYPDAPNFADLARQVRSIYTGGDSERGEPRPQAPVSGYQPRYQEPAYQHPGNAEPQPQVPAAVQAFAPHASRRQSELAVQVTLRELLYELDVKMHRRQAPAEVDPSGVVHNLSEGSGRPSRGIIRRVRS
jgi:hypothetical protein